jgi:transposase
MEGKIIGIDLGKKNMEVKFLGKTTGKDSVWNCKTDLKGRKSLYKRIDENDIVGIEACSLAFVIAKEIIEQTGAKVIVLNPGKLAVIYQSTKKTDTADAMKIARLIQRFPIEELPTVPIPTEKEMRDQAIVKETGFTKQERTRYINRLHAQFTGSGITTIVKSELTHYVMSVPGVGPQTALAFLAYFGDGKRFSTEKEVGNYSGLVPRVDISGSIVRYGSIIKRGCVPIRRVAIQASWALVRNRNGGALANKFHEMRTRIGNKKAIVAIARKLIILLWVLVKNREYYNCFDHEKHESKMRYYKIRKKWDR